MKFVIGAQPVGVGAKPLIPDDWVEQGRDEQNVNHWNTNANYFRWPKFIDTPRGTVAWGWDKHI